MTEARPGLLAGNLKMPRAQDHTEHRVEIRVVLQNTTGYRWLGSNLSLVTVFPHLTPQAVKLGDAMHIRAIVAQGSLSLSHSRPGMCVTPQVPESGALLLTESSEEGISGDMKHRPRLGPSRRIPALQPVPGLATWACPPPPLPSFYSVSLLLPG